MIVIASDNDRLDYLVYKHLKSLDDFSLVLEMNPHLITKTHLNAGDKVYLPDLAPVTKQESKSKTLW